MKKFLVVLGILLVCVIITIMGGLIYYKNQLGPVSNSSDKVEFVVEQGDNYYTIATKLKKLKLIKSSEVYKIYLKLNPQKNRLNVGIYYLSPNMGVSKIIKILSQGNVESTDIKITFKEGKNMRYIAKTIADNTDNSEEDVYNLLKDQTYLNELITNYWFIDKSILDTNIYYSLEGYLYPNTYSFKDKKVTVKEIFKVMLDETSKKIEPYKNDIINSKYNFHQIATLASIVELEAGEKYRADVAGVFFNRLEQNMPLGSDVTTYYAAKVDMGERDLYTAELNDVNSYNTRVQASAGKLPAGPICNPSISSIAAVLKPTNNSYYYFVADKNGEVHFTNTYEEHLKVIQQLKDSNLWYVYQK